MLSRNLLRKALCGMLISFAASVLAGCERAGTGHDESGGNSGSDVTILSQSSPPAARFADVVDAGNDTISVRKIDPAAGQSGGGGCVPKASAPRSVTIHPSGKFAYAANDFSDRVSAWQLTQQMGR